MIIAGLALTVVGWVFQMYRTLAKKDNKLNPAFLGVYAAGCILIAISNFLDNDATGGFLNALDVILPLTILSVILFARKTA